MHTNLILSELGMENRVGECRGSRGRGRRGKWDFHVKYKGIIINKIKNKARRMKRELDYLGLETTRRKAR